MNPPLEQHQAEIQQNLRSWKAKPLLQKIYAGFYDRIVTLIDERVPGRIVEIGSGIGNLKSRLPRALATDLFPNPWLDLVCDGYELPFCDGTVSHLVLFDVFHHLEAPNAFLKEARRVLAPSGRLIVFEPFISVCSFPVYGLLHHEAVAMGKTINLTQTLPRPRAYYAAQGNATRLFFRKETPGWPANWNIFHNEAFSAFHYLLSGGFSKPAMYPAGWIDAFRNLDASLSRWPRVFGGRCLVGMCSKE
ncbi:MAG: class I SAM-dependent methyltransferase [Verrucomicrobia bacterium]|jgi:SAM-dependent methyltransferase|nr:class I SAM-dependent methyltransferase [Verrucomicrobiota bacterium]